jgi:phosphomethylpyrimidine synthase
MNRASLPPLQLSDFTDAFPGSSKVYVEEHGVRVPMREIALTNGESLRVYDTSGPQGHDVRQGLAKLRAGWVATRRNTSAVTQLHYARQRRDAGNGVRRGP